MNRRSVSPRAAASQNAFEAKLKANPGLAEAYIQVTQEFYDQQVKSGELPPAEAKKVKVLIRQLKCEMTSFIVRQALAKIGKQMLRLKNKRWLTPKDMSFVVKSVELELPALRRRLQVLLKAEREELESFMERVRFQAVLFGERFFVQQFGKAGTKEMLSKHGLTPPSERLKQADRLRVQSRPRWAADG